MLMCVHTKMKAGLERPACSNNIYLVDETLGKHGVYEVLAWFAREKACWPHHRGTAWISPNSNNNMP